MRFDKVDHLSIFTVCKILTLSISDWVIFYYLLVSVSWNSLCKAVIGNLFYVVHHAIQQPLDIDFYFAPQTKSVHAFVHPYVGKHRLYNAHSQWIYLTPLLGLNFFHHCLWYVFARCIRIIGKMPSFSILILQTLGSEITAPAIGFGRYISS